MNYERIYGHLINRAKARAKSQFLIYENHHIIPRCLGGNDSKENLVLLTPEEHFICHQLLVKIYPRNSKILYAVVIMTGGGNGRGLIRSNKAYGWIRRRVSRERTKALSEMGDSHPMRNPEIAAKVSAKLKGVPKPWMQGDANPARKEGFREKVKGDKNPAKRPEVRKQISEALRKDRSKPFVCIETGAIYQTFEECLIWLRSLGYSHTQRASIQKVLSGKNKTRYGFHFQYCEKPE